MNLRSLRSSAAVLLLFAGTASADSGPVLSKEVDAAVREVVQRYVDSREARDAEALAAILDPSVDQLVSNGTWRRGRAAAIENMLESSRKNPAKRTIEVETVRLLTPDVALADGRYIHADRAGDAGTERMMWTSLILTRSADGWKITAIRNMLPTAPSGNASKP